MKLLESIDIFPVLLTLVAFQIGQACQKRWKKPIFNPTLIGMVLVTVFVAVSGMDPDGYTAETFNAVLTKIGNEKTTAEEKTAVLTFIYTNKA